MRVLYTTSDALTSRLIRLVDGGSASHCGIVLDGMVWDSTWMHGGVQAWPGVADWARMEGRRVVADHTFLLPDDDSAARWVREQHGRRYDTWGMLGIAIWRSRQHPGRLWCSEYVAGMLRAGGYMQPDDGSRFGVRLAMATTAALHHA